MKSSSTASTNGGESAANNTSSSQRRSQRGKGAGGRSSSSSSSYAAATASSLAAGGPSNPAPLPARPSSAASTTTRVNSMPKMARTTKSRISSAGKRSSSSASTGGGSSSNDEGEKENAQTNISNPPLERDDNASNGEKAIPSKSGGGSSIHDGDIIAGSSSSNHSPPAGFQSPTPYWKVLHERGDGTKTSPRLTRSAKKKAETPTTANATNNKSFEMRMQALDEFADDDDDEDANYIATSSSNHPIDPTLLHFSPHNKQFLIESAGNSKRRRDAELQKEQVWMEKARNQLGGTGGGGANKRMTKRAKRGGGAVVHPPSTATTLAQQEEANASTSETTTQMQMLLDEATKDGNMWMERARQWEGQCDTHKARCEVLTSELDFAKSEVRRLQDTNTEHAVSLALLQSKLDQTIAERDAAVERIGIAELAKDEAVKEAVAKVMSDVNGPPLSEMKVECDDLRSQLKMQQEDICKLLDVDIALVEFKTSNARSVDGLDSNVAVDGGAAKISFQNIIKQRLDEYQKCVMIKDEAEKRVQICVAELEKVKSDYQSLKQSVETKERDMTELMRSVGDIQRSGQDREEVVTNRLAIAESQVVECREKIVELGYENKSLEEALDALKSACSAQEVTIASLRKEISESNIETANHDSQLQLERGMRSKAEEKASEERAEQTAQAAKLNAQLQEHVESEKQLRASMESMRQSFADQIHLLTEENENKDGEIKKCNEVIARLEARQLTWEQSLSKQKAKWDASKEEEIGRLRDEITNLESRLTTEVRNLQSAGMANEAKVQELEAIIRQGLMERKRMHNIIQELRGNVRVFARIRPFLPDDGEQGNDSETPSVYHFGDEQLSVANLSNPSQRHKFAFDRVFAPSAGQEDVFAEVSELVQSALDGYNVCLFSYGQTGSGKTHTMQGAGTGVMRGLIPRCLEQIGLHKIAEEKDGWEFSMEVSFLEIYNETLKDLLRLNLSQECKHEIKVGTDGRRTVTDLIVKVVDPNDRAAVDAILALAAKRRATGSTDMNATSSRSHSVFTLNITAMHVERNQVVRGTLNLVDLAGSERLDRSNATGQRQKETVAINKSLSSLVDVFTAIGQKSTHIPFRNSKLTYLLQPALSGDGKTCMIVNLSPTEASVPETLCSLRFASKVNMCELGKAKRTIGELKSEVSTQSNIASIKSGAVSRNVKRKL